MILKRFVLLLVCLNFFFIFSQDYSLLHTQWLANRNIGIRFDARTVESDEFSFFSTYHFSGDTLTIFHDYSTLQCYTVDSLGNQIECPDWKLPNSIYLIHKLNMFELSMYPLNASAMKISHEINRTSSWSYDLSVFEKLIKKYNGQNPEFKNHDDYLLKFRTLHEDPSLPQIDTIKLKSKASVYEELRFDSLFLSYEQFEWNVNYYYDLNLKANGRFVVSYQRDESDSVKFGHKPAKLGLFKGKIKRAIVNIINDRLSESGVSATPSTIYDGDSDHAKRIRVTIYYNGMFRRYEGKEYFFPLLLKPFIEQILQINDYENYKPRKKPYYFESSFLK